MINTPPSNWDVLTMAKQTQFQKGVAWLKKQRAKGKGKKRHQMGVGGKAGAMIAGLGPLTIAGLDAAQFAQSQIKSRELTPLSGIYLGFAHFLNDLSVGFGFGDALPDVMVTNKRGVLHSVPANSGVPRGSLWNVVGTGGAMIGVDRLLAWVSGSGTNIPGTRVRAIGN